MEDRNSVRGPSGSAAGGADREAATETFTLLGDETRLAILLALWEEYDPYAADNTVRFTELFDSVSYDNPGSFRYHLRQLEGRFIRQRAAREGYELRVPGLQLVQAVVAGAGRRGTSLEPAEIDQECPFCGAPTAIRYQEGLLFQFCTECEGTAPDRTAVDGFLNAVPFDPAGLSDRTPAEIRTASRVGRLRQTQAMFDGVCPTCSGPVDGWFECCVDHDPEGVCEDCGTRSPARARFQCAVCKDHSATSPKSLALFHPAVIAFYENRGVSTRFRASNFESVKRGFELVDDHGVELVSEDPARVDVEIQWDGDELGLTFDETVAVVDVRR